MAVQNLIFFSLLISLAYGHSWVSCTDYRITSLGQTQVYQDSQCVGYGRAWSQCCENSAFGLDRGFNYQPGNSGKLCRNSLNTGNNYQALYSTDSPMAKYSPGQRVCLAWAPKNHVAASCINKDIPDNGMEVYMSGPNPTSDPDSLSKMTKIADWGKNPGGDVYKGFQNCPNFCSNPDKATCTGCFEIPKTVQVGAVYTFIWTWEFNAVSDQYSTCWEAQIVSSTQGTAVSLPSGYSNIASSTGINPSPPVATSTVRTSAGVRTSAPVRTSSGAKTSAAVEEPEDTNQEATEDPEETHVTPRPTNHTVIYVFAGANSVAVQGYLIMIAVVMAVILAQ